MVLKTFLLHILDNLNTMYLVELSWFQYTILKKKKKKESSLFFGTEILFLNPINKVIIPNLKTIQNGKSVSILLKVSHYFGVLFWHLLFLTRGHILRSDGFGEDSVWIWQLAKRWSWAGHSLTFLLVSPEASAPEEENTKHKSLAETSSPGSSFSDNTWAFTKPATWACLH